ncbi:hypothetical protein AB3S75_046967 [Citrus x aurantiifolia]
MSSYFSLRTAHILVCHVTFESSMAGYLSSSSCMCWHHQKTNVVAEFHVFRKVLQQMGRFSPDHGGKCFCVNFHNL